MKKALLFRLLPTLLLSFAILATAGIVAAKLLAEKTRASDDAVLTQWNETERLSLAWGDAVSALSRALTDLTDMRLSVEVVGTEIRYVEGKGEGPAAWSGLAPGTALVLRTGVAGRFEGRLRGGGFVQAKELGLKSFPTPGEGIVFLRRPDDGALFVLAPQPESVVLASIPPLLVAKLLGTEPRAAGVTYALVASPGAWSSQAAPPRGPSAQGAIVHSSDTAAFTQAMFAPGSKLRGLIDGPSRFELQERKGALSFRLAGMGSAPILGTNLRLVTQWKAEVLPTRLLAPVGQDIALVCVAAIVIAGAAFVERARFLAAGRGLKEAVRGILYQRELPGAGDWTLAPHVKEEFGDVLRNVNRLTVAHRALHTWGGAWARGFDAVEGGASPFFRPVKDVAAELGFLVNVTHDTEWQVHLAPCPALDASLLLVVRAVDFRSELVRTFLSHGLRGLALGGEGLPLEAARAAVAEWLEKAGALVHEEDPLVWGVFSWGIVREGTTSRWALAGRAGRAGLAVMLENDPMRLQWGDELIAEITPGTPPAFDGVSKPEGALPAAKSPSQVNPLTTAAAAALVSAVAPLVASMATTAVTSAPAPAPARARATEVLESEPGGPLVPAVSLPPAPPSPPARPVGSSTAEASGSFASNETPDDGARTDGVDSSGSTGESDPADGADGVDEEPQREFPPLSDASALVEATGTKEVALGDLALQFESDLDAMLEDPMSEAPDSAHPLSQIGNDEDDDGGGTGGGGFGRAS